MTSRPRRDEGWSACWMPPEMVESGTGGCRRPAQPLASGDGGRPPAAAGQGPPAEAALHQPGQIAAADLRALRQPARGDARLLPALSGEWPARDFNLPGVPIRVVLRRSENPYAGKSRRGKPSADKERSAKPSKGKSPTGHSKSVKPGGSMPGMGKPRSGKGAGGKAKAGKAKRRQCEIGEVTGETSGVLTPLMLGLVPRLSGWSASSL